METFINLYQLETGNFSFPELWDWVSFDKCQI